MIKKGFKKQNILNHIWKNVIKTGMTYDEKLKILGNTLITEFFGRMANKRSRRVTITPW